MNGYSVLPIIDFDSLVYDPAWATIDWDRGSEERGKALVEIDDALNGFLGCLFKAVKEQVLNNGEVSMSGAPPRVSVSVKELVDTGALKGTTAEEIEEELKALRHRVLGITIQKGDPDGDCGYWCMFTGAYSTRVETQDNQDEAYITSRFGVTLGDVDVEWGTLLDDFSRFRRR